MLSETITAEFSIYVQQLREPKDDYAKRKVQKDRQKLRVMINALLEDREVIIFYKDNEVEKQVIGTKKKPVPQEEWPPLPDLPKTIEIINNKEVPEIHHCAFWLYPLREPILIHLDQITKFIVRNEGLTYEFYLRAKNEQP